MALSLRISLAAVALLPLVVFPVAGVVDARHGWTLAVIWLAAVAAAPCIAGTWPKIIWLMAVVHTAAVTLCYGAVEAAYIELLMVAVGLAAMTAFTRPRPRTMQSAILAGAVLLFIAGVMQRAGLIPVAGSLPAHNQWGPMNVNTASAFFAMATCAALSAGRTAVFLGCRCISFRPWWALPVIGAGLIGCHSTTGVLAAGAGVTVWAVTILRKRICMAALAGVAACVAVFLLVVDPPVKANCVRLVIWEAAGKQIAAIPWGHGLGSWAATSRIFLAGAAGIPAWEWVSNAHNEWVQAAYELGAWMPGAGLLMLLGYWRLLAAMLFDDDISPYWKWDMGRIAGGLAASAVAACGTATLHVVPTALITLAWLAQAERIRQMEEMSWR